MRGRGHARRSGEHEAGVVRLGVLSTVESSLLPEVVRRLHKQHAALVVSVVTGPSAHLLDQLRVGALDLVVGRMTDSPQIEGLTFEHLYSESMILVVRPAHPLLQADLQDRSQLGDYPVVLPLAGTTIRRYADSLYVQCGIVMPQQRLETLSVALSRRYVQSSDAVWIAPQDAVRQDLVRRFGDYVLFTPPVRAGTWLLWFGPFALILLAGGTLILRARRRPIEVAPLSPEEEHRLQDILANEKLRRDPDASSPHDGRLSGSTIER